MFAKTLIATLAATAILASASTAALAAPAAARPADPDAISKSVFVGDLDLSSRAGARVAVQRIRAAAAAVCGDSPDPRFLERTAPYHACIRTAVDQAVASLDRPIVTALR